MADRTVSFASIAHVYNRYTDLTAYEQWLAYTLKNVPFHPQKALDVASGTGYFTRLWAEYCDYILGVDIDPEMVRIASEDTSSKVMNVQFQQADMLDMKHLAQDFDVITCYADALCFLENDQAVIGAFQNMHQCLNVGGVLLFDVWTPFQIKEGFKNYSYHDADDKGALLWDSFTNEKDLSVVHEITVFDQLKDGLFERIEVDLHERTYHLEDYLSFLHTAGFNREKIRVTVDYGETGYTVQDHAETDRWFFRVEK